MPDLTNAELTAAFADLSDRLDAQDAALRVTRRAEMAARVAPPLSARAPMVGQDRVADTLGNVNPYPAQKNLLLDPTLESIKGPISGAEAVIGWGSRLRTPAWLGQIVSGCGTSLFGWDNIHLVYRRDEVAANALSSATIMFDTGSVAGAGTHEIRFRSYANRVLISDKLPFLVASVRVFGCGTNQNSNVSSMSLTLEIWDQDDATVRASATTTYAAYTGPLTCSMLLSGQAWAMHYLSLRLRFVVTTTGGTGVYAQSAFAEPQLNQSHSDNAPMYQPLLGAWVQNAYPSVAQVLVAASPLLVNADIVQLMCTGAVTTTAAPTIADGVDGQWVTVLNVGTGTWTIKDQGTLAASNLRLTGATVALAPRQSVGLMYSAAIGDWVQVGPLVTVI